MEGAEQNLNTIVTRQWIDLLQNVKSADSDFSISVLIGVSVSKSVHLKESG
jgi:hypothetical protein